MPFRFTPPRMIQLIIIRIFPMEQCIPEPGRRNTKNRAAAGVCATGAVSQAQCFEKRGEAVVF